MIAKDCKERLSAVALSVDPHYSARLMRFGSRGPSEFSTEMPCTGTRHGNVYRSVREKQGNVIYRQHVLQTVTSLRVVSLVFRGHDLQKIANTNPQREATLSLWKKLVPRAGAPEMEPRSWLRRFA